jgi:hypothetical protein
LRAWPLERKPATSMTGTLGVEGSSAGLFTPSRRAQAGPVCFVGASATEKRERQLGLALRV